MNFLYFIYKTVVKRNQGAIAPGFLQDLGAVELVGVQYAVHFLARADAVGVVLFLLYNKLSVLSILDQYRNPAGARYGIGAAGKINLSINHTAIQVFP